MPQHIDGILNIDIASSFDRKGYIWHRTEPYRSSPAIKSAWDPMLYTSGAHPVTEEMSKELAMCPARAEGDPTR